MATRQLSAAEAQAVDAVSIGGRWRPIVAAEMALQGFHNLVLTHSYAGLVIVLLGRLQTEFKALTILSFHRPL